MPNFKLNGQELSFEPGDTVIRAAWKAGIEIPHYCWHPGLSVAANCRMCLVHVESGRQMAMPILTFDAAKKAYVPDTKPKLQPACQLQAQEGMEVSSTSDEVKSAQAHVQEFLLLNHPVDCPICDQAGECKLQDYWYENQATLKRKETEPVHKPKGVRFGPTIVYDAERCISCTRCIRVCDELAKDPVLDSRERGNRTEIFVSPGRELDHKYSLMTEHVCPVGALTSRDFRFKARVWFLKSAPGVCVGCATGCNTHIDYDPRYGKVYRIRPRDNEDVNKYWMCDDGMMTYTRQREDRVLSSSVGRGEDREPVMQSGAIAAAADQLGKVDAETLAIVLSAQSSCEDNYVLARLAKSLGVERLYLAALGGWEGDDILRSEDNNPNRAGAEMAAKAAGLSLEKGVEALIADVSSGAVSGVLALGCAGVETLEQVRPIASLDAVVSLTSNAGALPAAASIVLPVSSWAESHGTFVNGQGRAQEFARAIPSPSGVEPAFVVLSKLAKALGHSLDYERIQDIRAELFKPEQSAASAEATV